MRKDKLELLQKVQRSFTQDQLRLLDPILKEWIGEERIDVSYDQLKDIYTVPEVVDEIGRGLNVPVTGI